MEWIPDHKHNRIKERPTLYAENDDLGHAHVSYTWCQADLCTELQLTSDLGPQGSRGVCFDDQHCPTLYTLAIKTTHPQHTIAVDSTCVNAQCRNRNKRTVEPSQRPPNCIAILYRKKPEMTPGPLHNGRNLSPQWWPLLSGSTVHKSNTSMPNQNIIDCNNMHCIKHRVAHMNNTYLYKSQLLSVADSGKLTSPTGLRPLPFMNRHSLKREANRFTESACAAFAVLLEKAA